MTSSSLEVFGSVGEGGGGGDDDDHQKTSHFINYDNACTVNNGNVPIIFD